MTLLDADPIRHSSDSRFLFFARAGEATRRRRKEQWAALLAFIEEVFADAPRHPNFVSRAGEDQTEQHR